MVGAVMVVKLFVGWNFIKIEKTKQETKKTNKEEHKQNECGTLYTRLNIFFSNYNNMEEFTFFYLLQYLIFYLFFDPQHFLYFFFDPHAQLELCTHSNVAMYILQKTNCSNTSTLTIFWRRKDRFCYRFIDKCIHLEIPLL